MNVLEPVKGFKHKAFVEVFVELRLSILFVKIGKVWGLDNEER